MPIDWTQLMSLFSKSGVSGTPGGYKDALNPLFSSTSSRLSPFDMQAGQPTSMATPVRWPAFGPTPRAGAGAMRGGWGRGGYGGTQNIPGIASPRGFPPASPATPPSGQDLSGLNWGAALSEESQGPSSGPLNVDTNSGIPGWQSPSSDYAPNSFTTIRAPDNEQPGPLQPTILGLSPERFALLAGVAAHAIDPYGVGGRLGSGAATIAAQDLRGQQAERFAWMNRNTGRSGVVVGGQSILRDPNNPDSGWITAPGVPPATPMGHSRPAYGGYPAIPGEWSPGAQELRGLAPGRTLPPENRDPNVAYTAPFRPLTPQEQAVVAGPGSTIIPAPGQVPIVAQPTYRQSTVTVGPGGAAVTGGKVTPVPGTTRQNTPTTTGGKPGKPKDISLVTGRADQAIHRKLGFDPKSDDLRQSPDYQTMLQAATAAMMNNQDFTVVRTPGAKGWWSNEPDRYRIVTGDSASQQIPSGATSQSDADKRLLNKYGIR